MRAELVTDLRCVGCGTGGALELSESAEDDREIRTGTLTCRSCGRRYGVDEGIVHLLGEPPAHVTREAAGLQRFADHMRAEGWDRKRILALPDGGDGYWWMQKASFEQLVGVVDPREGARLLDVGSNTCWASNLFARRGQSVVALDIALAEMQGLRTAEYFLEDGCPLFERVLGSMFDLPFADETFDYVFCCEVLHHNGPDTLRRAFEEMGRVLRPGGRLLVINEPLRFVMDLQRHHAEEVAEFEGNENVYFAPTYLRAARRAGFSISLLEPPNIAFFHSEAKPPPPGTPRFDALKLGIQRVLQRSLAGRRLYHRYRLLVRGEVALSFVGTKKPAG